MDYSEKLQIPKVVTSVNSILASDYYNAVESAISSGECNISEININKGYLAALVENELLNARNINDVVLERHKSLVNVYVCQLNKSEKMVYDTERKEMKRKSVKYGVKKQLTLNSEDGCVLIMRGCRWLP